MYLRTYRWDTCRRDPLMGAGNRPDRFEIPRCAREGPRAWCNRGRAGRKSRAIGERAGKHAETRCVAQRVDWPKHRCAVSPRAPYALAARLPMCYRKAAMQQRIIRASAHGWQGVEPAGYAAHAPDTGVTRHTIVGSRKNDPSEPGPKMELRYSKSSPAPRRD